MMIELHELSNKDFLVGSILDICEHNMSLLIVVFLNLDILDLELKIF